LKQIKAQTISNKRFQAWNLLDEIFHQQKQKLSYLELITLAH